MKTYIAVSGPCTLLEDHTHVHGACTLLPKQTRKAGDFYVRTPLPGVYQVWRAEAQGSNTLLATTSTLGMAESIVRALDFYTRYEQIPAFGEVS
jgi:hypothetical protein